MTAPPTPAESASGRGLPGELTLLIRDARIIDGAGGPSRTGDIGIAGDRIVAVEESLSMPARRVVDAAGRVACPGFIDLHSHVDLLVETYPRADGMLRQGATTLVTGNCGLSPFPTRTGESGWSSLADFADAVRSLPLAVNIAPLVGHGAIRSAAMSDPSARATSAELTKMAALTEQAMRDGAHGLSTGLIYDPGRFSTTDELVELASVVARYGGFYASHIRGEEDTLVEAVDEALTIGRTAGLAVQLSHHKAKRRRNWGRVDKTLRMVDDAVDAGMDVMLDNYPYTASSTSLWAYLPRWARKNDLLAIEGELPGELRTRLIRGMEERFPGCSAVEPVATDLNDLVIAQIGAPCHYSQYEGMRLAEAALKAEMTQADFVIELLLAGKAVQIIDHAMSEQDMLTVFAHPRCGVGSDARLIHPDIPGVPHPRNFGTFPRFISAVAPGLMSLEKAVFKCTGLPARRLGWTGRRGLLAPGLAADLLLFDPERLRDHSTFDDPKNYSTGLDLVIVNGQIAIESDEDTSAAAGCVLLTELAGDA
ncbi:N-acyl-D-amino-acid deacylase family protein [Aeromicrobium phragmitis]|nr:D-aminoacylase [Aeromicrobium phragmitis]